MFIKRILVFAALRLLKTQLLDKIQYAPIANYITGLYTRLEKVATIITDADPENEAQLKALWESEKSGIILDSLNATEEIVVLEFHNPDLLPIVLEILDALQAEYQNGGGGLAKGKGSRSVSDVGFTITTQSAREKK
jgi:hypothetical protein